jgi:hypothetical protein
MKINILKNGLNIKDGFIAHPGVKEALESK